MADTETGAMAKFGPSAPAGTETAGLVLLYANAFRSLPPAFRLARGTNVIGREPPADIVVPVNAVSRTHAEIVWERGGWTLRDRASTNGTLVDGHRTMEARLEHGQEVRVGDAILKFVDRDAELFGRYRLDGTMAPGTARLSRAGSELVGGYQMDRIAAEVERIATSPISVLLLGESGTGKEVVAREIHRHSGRKGPFRAINCAAIPENLFESELFGYKRGAFSGADRDKQGIVRAAHDGTLLLDEIGDLPLDAQAKLLRVLQSKEVYPLGATAPEMVDVRIVCATHRDLKRLEHEERFRPDLFARLNEYQLRLPPLRDRKEDVYQLLRAFLALHGGPNLDLSFLFMAGVLHYDFPYNVRELEACAKRAIALADGPILDTPLLPEPIREEMAGYGSAPSAEEHGIHPTPHRHGAPTESELRALLSQYEGNVAAVGRAVGKARMQIHRWVERYAIDLDDYRGEAVPKPED
ncbi:MAG TPA: sigma 54-interacting transcriptional regulator [Polyangiaceae bacterium]|jgi:DNA-binding NtrC family response regulator|nr:sigma 54-interacting transcriptional regulator [Polyangiaceae bacterium]